MLTTSVNLNGENVMQDKDAVTQMVLRAMLSDDGDEFMLLAREMASDMTDAELDNICVEVARLLQL